MKKILFVIISITSIILLSAVAPQEDDFPLLKGPYLGQECPHDQAELFLDGIISSAANPEMCAAFTEDGREFYFNAMQNGSWTIFFTGEKDGRWNKPVAMPFSSSYTDRDFTISPDGNAIYFGSDRPRKAGGSQSKSLDIFVTRRVDNGSWSQPKNLGDTINTEYGENYPSVARNGNLYFFSCRNEGSGGCEIYMSRFDGSKYLPSVNLGPAINSDRHDWDSFIAPDESYIIFSSQNRADTIGQQDLYISFRDEKGVWSQAVNMGPRVNSTADEICPSVSLDGKYLFFTSRRRGNADIFWITSDVIDQIRLKKE